MRRQPGQPDRSGGRSGQDPAVRIGPARYAAWRASRLGAVTEALEQRLLRELAGDPAGRRVLDVGCGDGVLACALAARGAEVSAVDADPAMVAAARARATQAGVGLIVAEGRLPALPYADGAFDLVVASTVLCFVPDAAQALRELARLLAPGGRLVIGELGRWSAWATIRRVRGRLGAETWRAARFRSAGELRALAEEAGLRVEAVRGAIYYPPVGAVARALAGLDSRLGRRTTIGAAFIALAARKPGG